ncbi:MAG: zinc ribbon domain-containing protein [Methanobacteriota archaeon]
MNKELYRPIARAITALILIILIKFAAVLTLKNTVEFYSFVDIALSIAVIIILLKFRVELNNVITNEDSRSIVTGLVLTLVIITLYVTFRPYSEFLPNGIYHIVFFLLLMVPLYFLWEVVHKNADRLSELFVLTEKRITCSCGRENPTSNKYCGGCGSHLVQRGDSE